METNRKVDTLTDKLIQIEAKVDDLMETFKTSQNPNYTSRKDPKGVDKQAI